MTDVNRDGDENFLKDETRQDYVTTNTVLLTEQAQTFYTDIITAIDSTIALEFEFAL